MKLIQRHGYIEFLRRNRERSIIKVVFGIRRCGKSTLFRLFKDETSRGRKTGTDYIYKF